MMPSGFSVTENLLTLVVSKMEILQFLLLHLTASLGNNLVSSSLNDILYTPHPTPSLESCN